MSSSKPPSAKVKLLIRRPAAEVFAALTRPEQLTKFWLSSASAPLEAGKTVHWEFKVQGSTVDCNVRELVPSSRILIDWSDGTKLTFQLESRADGFTVLAVENSGFGGSAAEALETALEATQGFAIVVCNLKTLLERGESAGLVEDKALLISEALRRQR